MKSLSVTPENFRRLLEDISTQTARANDPWRLFKGLNATMAQNAEQFNQTPAFWHVTFQALEGAALAYLGRIYDTQANTNSLSTFLRVVWACAKYFPEPHLLSSAEINDEISSVTDKDPLVKRLHDIRNKKLAHRPSNMVLGHLPSLGLAVTDIDALVSRADGITSKYDYLYRGGVISGHLHGHDDYKRLLRLVKQGADIDAAKLAESDRESASLQWKGRLSRHLQVNP